ncbi:ATP-binding protein [Kiloniella sp.]|uniref:hybrid sensor histidine kinase/response regulator n=1 Tax=Kiloniella sp. TaxID=1938587 RepID=UPI003B026329
MAINPPTTPITILLVDDDLAFAKTLISALKPLGYSVSVEQSAVKALLHQEQSPASLVIVNHTLPDRPGISLIKEFLSKYPDLQTVYITSTETEVLAAEALRVGVTCYINKDPQDVFFKVLPAILERTLNRTKAVELQKDLSDKLRKNQRRLSQAVAVSELGFWEWDDVLDRATYYSPELLQLYEMHENDLCHGAWTVQKDLKHVHPDDLKEYNYKSHFYDGTTDRYEVEFRIYKKDGSIVYLREIGQATRNEASQIVRSYGTVQDITKTKLAEIDLKEALNEAEKANRTKASFLATMSHELRTPLNAILGFSEILVSQSFGPLGTEKYLDYAKDIHNSGTNLLSLISDILEISNLEAGDKSLIKETVNLTRLITSCHKSVKPSFDQANIAVSLSLPKRLPPILADERALQQIILNLLSNAAKFTPEKGQVNIALTQSNEAITLSVEDNGPGIDDDHLAILLKPFTRLESDPHVSQDGIGLGLSIIKSLTEAHGGHLEIDSKVGRGTTFYVHLPSMITPISGAA